jgi:uncharacterized RDD family membrane protein YckC
MECPHCGFMNLLDSGECVRCRKPLPKPAGEAGEESSPSHLDLSEVKIEPVAEEPEAPAFPEHGEAVDISSPDLKPPATAAEAEVPEAAGPEPSAPGEDTETADVPFSPPPAGPAPPPLKAEPPAAPARPARPPRDEASATYEGSDPELKELSRFFHQIKKEREAGPEAPAPEKDALAPAAGEAEPAEESDSFVPEFKETLLPGMEEGSPSLAGEEAAPAAGEPGRLALLRLQAGLVDLGIHALILAALYFGATYGLSLEGLGFSAWLLRLALPLLILVAIIFVGYQVFFLATAGQTPGQMLLRLKVADEAGDALDLGRGLARALWVLVCGLPLALGLLLLFFNPQGLSLADKWSRTRVIRA